MNENISSDTDSNETENNEQIPLTSEKKENIYFYSRNDSDVKEYIIGKKEELIVVVGLDNNIDSGILIIGYTVKK